MVAFTRKFEQKISEEGCRYTFYCDICGSGYATPLFPKDCADDEAHFLKAQEDVKLLFNRCPVCRRMVCDKCFRILEERDLCKECATGSGDD